ncbi:MAG: LacI family DNA-binding transcriptional regulator [Desulfovibrionaceae bacterium]|nr:LacI family DNA-binding transcriptional regulator [Desulfovibrionaceae bacterium]
MHMTQSDSGTEGRAKSARRTRLAGQRQTAVTIKDVARLANVSLMTVSRAINSPDQVSEKTRLAVEEAIRKSGYIPNRLAGGLSSLRTRQVAVLVPSLSNLVFADMLSGLSSVLEPAGMQMMVFNYHYHEEQMERQIPHALSWAPDGLVVAGRVPESISPMLRERGLPVVEAIELLDSPVDCNVGIDHFRAGAAMAAHLADLGYRRAAVISATPLLAARTGLRVKGFAETFTARGGAEPAQLVVEDGSSISEGGRAMRSLLSGGERPEVVFCANDDLAFGAMMACLDAGLRVPEDIGIAGFNGLDIALHCRPRLCTVQVDRKSIGLMAGRLLLARIDGSPNGQCLDAGFIVIAGQSTRSVSQTE